MKSPAKRELEKILSDNVSGSYEILTMLLKWCDDYSYDEAALLEMISLAQNRMKSFSAIQLFIKEFKKVVKGNDERKIKEYLQKKTVKIKNRYEFIFRNSLSFLKDCKRIVTLSNSKTILEILRRLNELNKISVTIGESRPQLEGRILTKELLKKNIKTEIIPDTLLTAAVEYCDCAVIGADIILSNGDVVNKTGSRGVAIACRYFNKPFYVLAATDKFSKIKKYIPEKRDEKEIWQYNHKLLKRTSYYFEVIEKKLITKIIHD